MKSISSSIAQGVTEALAAAQKSGELPEIELPHIVVSRSSKPDHGDYGSPVAMQLQGPAGRTPPEIAALIVKHFPSLPEVSEVVQMGGFVNFRLSRPWLQDQVTLILEKGSAYATSSEFDGKRAQVECVSANPTGPITVGRIRGGVIGDTLSRLLIALGYTVEKEYYFNNAGGQMRKLGQSVEARYLELLGHDIEFPEDGYQGPYIKDIAAAIQDEFGDTKADAGWEFFKDIAEERLFESIRASLRAIGISFDTFFNENSLYEDGSVDDILDRLRERDLLYEANSPLTDDDFDQRDDLESREAVESGAALWVKMRQLREVGTDKAVKKSSGEPTYRLPDTAYHVNKFERGFDLLVNILGADHIEEAKDVRAMLAALGYDVEKLHVILHQFVTLSDGRMSTRKGEYVTLDEVVEDVGPDAVRYFMLARSPQSHMDFDLDLARKQSNENPVFYIQNAHVRCVSMARKAADEFGYSSDDGDVTLLVDEQELSLIKKLIELPDVIHQAATNYEPHKLAFWAHEELAKVFHPTYEIIRALHSDVPEDLAKARLKLYAAAQIIIKITLDLLGMQAPESM